MIGFIKDASKKAGNFIKNTAIESSKITDKIGQGTTALGGVLASTGLGGPLGGAMAVGGAGLSAQSKVIGSVAKGENPGKALKDWGKSSIEGAGNLLGGNDNDEPAKQKEK